MQESRSVVTIGLTITININTDYVLLHLSSGHGSYVLSENSFDLLTAERICQTSQRIGIKDLVRSERDMFRERRGLEVIDDSV